MRIPKILIITGSLALLAVAFNLTANGIWTILGCFAN